VITLNLRKLKIDIMPVPPSALKGMNMVVEARNVQPVGVHITITATVGIPMASGGGAPDSSRRCIVLVLRRPWKCGG